MIAELEADSVMERRQERQEITEKQHANIAVGRVLAMVKRYLGGEANQFGDDKKARMIAETLVFEHGIRNPEHVTGILSQFLRGVNVRMKPLDIVYDRMRHHTERGPG